MENEKGLYRIERKFGKGIVDDSGNQVAWIDDFNIARRVCMFLNSDDYGDGSYPCYVDIGGDSFKLSVDGMSYWSDRRGVSVGFTVIGVSLYSVSGEIGRDGVYIKEISRRRWLRENGDYIE